MATLTTVRLYFQQLWKRNNNVRSLEGPSPSSTNHIDSVRSEVGMLNSFLSVLSSVYSVGVGLHRVSYEFSVLTKTHLRVPVISVGNITVGGNGKTPFVHLLVKDILKHKKCLVMMRDYGEDESKMSKALLPNCDFVLGKNRVDKAAEMLKQSTATAELALLDDGFQHWNCARDIDIVMINALSPFGNGHMIPRGPMREPLAALARAHAIVFNHADHSTPSDLALLRASLQQYTRPDMVWACTTMVPEYLMDPAAEDDSANQLPVSALSGKHIVCFAGLGQPDAFFATVRQLSGATADSCVCIEYPDHHVYTAQDIHRILQASTQVSTVDVCFLTSEKDWYRCSDIFRQEFGLGRSEAQRGRLYVLRSSMKLISGGEALQGLFRGVGISL
eukprot:GILK01007038.1.p1 GENE.GILK01007038.1~~GILK01007038.1.p1  ORF type:complete len:403 (+),score=32.27 GILK01007038.1:41-1210(+)